MKEKHGTLASDFLIVSLFCLFLTTISVPAPCSAERPEPVQAAVSQETSPPAQEVPREMDTQPDEEAPAVEIYPEQQRLIGVKTVEVALKPVTKTIRTVGRIEADERKVTTVNILYEGWIEKLFADYAGKYVSKGEPLAEIYSPEVTSVQLEYLNLINWINTQIPRFQREIEFEWGDRYGTVGKLITYDPQPLIDVARQRFKLWGFTEAEIKELETKQEPFKRITLRSPVSGYVFQKPTFRGTKVAEGEKIFDIVDLSTVWVLADIYEYEIPFVKEGQEARITLSYFPEKTFNTTVDFIYPTLSGETRTVKARFVLENPGFALKPRMFANVELRVDLGERLVIPRDALLDSGLRQIVYVDRGEGYFQPRQVRTGVRTETLVEILAGVRAGEWVASRPVFLIDSEAKLKGIVR